MTSQRDQKAAAYSAIIGLLESRIISPTTRQELERLRDEIEKEIVDELNKSKQAAAS